jgi:hypothetical protein
MSISTLFYKKINDPLVQAVILVLAGLIMMCLNWAFNQWGFIKTRPLFPWSLASALALFFALVNSLLSLKAESFAKYWGRSMYSYMGMVFCLGSLAWLFSGIAIREAGTYRWIFFVVTFGFLVFLSMVNFMKNIVHFAEREEWNQPRKRSR